MSLTEIRKSAAMMRTEIVPFDLEQSYYASSIRGAVRTDFPWVIAPVCNLRRARDFRC